MTNHPLTIAPSNSQICQWYKHLFKDPVVEEDHIAAVFTEIFQAGADQELEACCKWIANDAEGHAGFDGEDGESLSNNLRDARRPKPPTLAEQGLKVLEPPSGPVILSTPEYRLTEFQAEILRAALNRLAKLEAQAND